MRMNDTDFDALCEGASPVEAKRLRKLLADWCDGDEHSFPVQLALIKGLADTAETKNKALATIVATHTEVTRKAVSDMRGQLLNTEAIARHIQNELDQGALAWKQAKADFEDERKKLEATRKQL